MFRCFIQHNDNTPLTPESIELASLALQGIHHVKGRDGLSLGVLGIRDRVADHALQEALEHGTRLLVNEARDTLDSTTTRETADCGLGDSLDIVTQDWGC